MSSIVVRPNGQIEFIYKDCFTELLLEGEATVKRASHVEPLVIQWTADMGPVGGPVLGPFPTRADALAAEVAWLEENLGL